MTENVYEMLLSDWSDYGRAYCDSYEIRIRKLHAYRTGDTQMIAITTTMTPDEYHQMLEYIADMKVPAEFIE